MDYFPLVSKHYDLDNLLLLQLSYQDIVSLKSVNKYSQSFINNSKFWTRKLHYDYGEVIPEKIKNDYNKCKELYQKLLANDDLKLLAFAEQQEYFEVVTWMVKRKKSIFTSGTNLLAKYGQLDILKNHLRFTCPDQKGATWAALNEHYETVNYIRQKWQALPNIGTIIEEGKDEVLITLIKKYDFKITQSDVNHAAICGKIKLVKYLAQLRNFPNNTGLNNTAGAGQLEVLKFLATYQYFPDSTGSNNALKNSHYDVVNWLKQQNIKPDQRAISALIEQDNLTIITEFLNNNIKPTNEQFRLAVRLGYLAIVELFLQYQLKPDGFAIDQAIINHDLKMLRLFERHDIIPDNKSANKAAQYGYIDILDWLLVYNILPNQEGANKAAADGELASLKWLVKYHILPNVSGADKAALNGHLDILLWLEQHDILPDPNMGDMLEIAHKATGMHVIRRINMIEIEQEQEIEFIILQYLEILKFLFNHGILPDPFIIESILYSKNIAIINLLVECYIFPSKIEIDNMASRDVLIPFLKENGLY